MVGDGHCNDEANNLHCDFDGGDCCYSCISKAFCSDCKCLTDNAGEELNYPLIGDGFCQDEINNIECNYDGGDCCGHCVINEYCSECLCLHNSTSHEYSNPLMGNGLCNKVANNFECSYDFGDCCPNPDLVADGFCNDEVNNVECNFDGGDCCLSPVKTDLCDNCMCFVDGVITSPGFPFTYTDNKDVSWLVKVALGQYIQIYFLYFSVEYQSSW